ncbi:hypothetical protein AMJ87_10235 [candidate division WOR_3 bacterium SM23_60]|uniref:Fibronectin type-III domain-containing protein n=1 Tax=candidate division WOR_3 bacterium SM23_60 TaxID=1703780 RepID=A0A0S8GBX3_UNCW3|nr:MAG: hypothetical protein AMJ87_10235 [candidate division WOR_3 bacterium SM23_60]
MKKIWLALTICFAALLVFNGCGETETGAPMNLEIEAANDGLQVVLSWEAPDADEPDGYIIYFRPVGTSDWLVGDTVDALTYTHDPNEETGDYRIAAYYGDDEFNSGTVTTIPVHTGAVSISELNAAGNSGYGWAISGDFTGSTYSMADASNAPFVDFYVTDFAAGTANSGWYVASPNEGPNDPGGVVPDDSWRQSWVTDPITDPDAALPAYGATTYFNWTPDIEVDPTYVGIYLDNEEHFGLIKFSGVNTGNGTIQAETWFQTVQGLRLVAH